MATGTNKGTTFRIFIIGDFHIGKSSIRARFVNGTYNEKHAPTICNEVLCKELNVNGKVVNLAIWDTMGQERFRSVSPQSYRNASAIIFVYDITDEGSFGHLQTYWFPTVLRRAAQDVALAVVGNKLDLEDSGRVVSTERARNYADIQDAVFVETSAKTGTNVDQLFTELVLKIWEKKRESSDEPEPESFQLDSPPSETGEQHRKCCNCKGL